MDRDPRGTISQQGNVMRIDNAFVEEVVPANRSSNGYLLVSYATAGANRTTSIQNLRLNITRNTVLLDSLGRQIRLSDIRTGRVAMVDPDNEILYTGNPFDVNSQTKYLLSNATITDRSGRPISIRALQPGQRVRITHANFQTSSIPPQTTAFHVQLL